MPKVILPHWINKDDVITDCQDVEAFAFKYRKPSRFHNKDKDYRKAVLKTHKEEMKTKGYSAISQHDNITGKFIVFVDPKNEIEWTTKNQNAKQKDATT